MGAAQEGHVRQLAEPGFGTGLLHRTAAHILDGNDVVILTPMGGGPVLDLLSIALAARKCRVLRATGAEGGCVEGLVGQVSAEAGGMPTAGATLLAAPGPGCTRTVLLVSQAHRLTRDEYRFLHRAALAGPLQFVLAAPTDPVVHLDGDLAPLHNRINAYAPLVIEPGTPLAVLVPPRPPSAARPAPLHPAPLHPAPLHPAQVRTAQVRAAQVRAAQGAQHAARSVRRVRTGWLVAIAASAVVTMTGAQIQFDWLGLGSAIVGPAMAAPSASPHPGASFVTLPAPAVAAPGPAAATTAATPPATHRFKARQPEAPAR